MRKRDMSSWVAIDVNIDTHPKFIGLTEPQKWAWLQLVCYCQRHLTDGQLPGKVVSKVCQTRSKVDALLRQSLLIDKGGDCYELAGYLKWHKSKQEIESTRKLNKDRQDRYVGHKRVSDASSNALITRPHHITSHNLKETLPSVVQRTDTKRGTRVPDSGASQEVLGEWLSRWGIAATEPGLETFLDYWRGCAGQKGVKLDWGATWRNWKRNDEKRANSQTRLRAVPIQEQPVTGPRWVLPKEAV